MPERLEDSLAKVPLLDRAKTLLGRIFGQRVDDTRGGVRGKVGKTLIEVVPDPLERAAWAKVKASGVRSEEVLSQTGDEDGLRELALQFLVQGELIKAETILKRHFGETISPMVFEDIGDYLLSQEKFEEAIYAYRSAQAQAKFDLVYTSLIAHYIRPKERGRSSYNIHYFQRVFQMLRGRPPSRDELMALGESILAGGGNEILARDALLYGLKGESSKDKKTAIHKRLGDLQMKWYLELFADDYYGSSGYLRDAAKHYHQANDIPGLLRVAELSFRSRHYNIESIFALLKLCGVEDPKAWIKEKARKVPRIHRVRLFELADITDGLIELGQECLAELKGGKDDEVILQIAFDCFSAVDDNTGLKEVGDFYRARGNFDRTRECYTVAGYEPNDPDYYQALGEHFCRKNAPADAQKAFLKALQLRKGGGDGGGGGGGLDGRQETSPSDPSSSRVRAEEARLDQRVEEKAAA